jgi:hypothetical protein
MSQSPEKDQPEHSPDDLQDRILMKELAHDLAVLLKKPPTDEHEPFELYAYELKIHLLADEKAFQTRFVKGYEVLLEGVRAIQ